MNLDDKFIEKMKTALGDEFNSFMDSYDDERYYGIKINTLKISVEDFLKISPFELDPVPWCSEGFYYYPEKCNVIPSKHPYYHAGLYYIQEPSAMAPVCELDPKPGDVVLDLCASPGGKTVQIAGRLDGDGLIVTNDISTGRIKPLVKNIELYGIKNAYVINEDHFDIASKLQGYFTKILVDAPCSGEGMFRKDQNAYKAWSPEYVKECADKQTSIMDEISTVLGQSGEMVYSTCTFSREEDEDIIDAFVDSHEFFEKVQMKTVEGFATKEGYSRLWPHRIKGEGHFLAHIRENGDGVTEGHYTIDNTKSPDEVSDFIKENLHIGLEGAYQIIKEKVYILPDIEINTKGLRVARSGWYIGDIVKGRFKPSQALAMGLKKEDAKRVINLAVGSLEVIKYLKCETINSEGENGLNLICVDGYPLGWGKLSGGVLKNMYPAAWRMV